MKPYQFTFENLKVWEKSIDLAKAIYLYTNTFPKEEKYGLISQIRRAVISVSSNLAEGSGRQSGKDKAHFSTLAYGSLMELVNQAIIANQLGYLKEENYQEIRDRAEEISRMLTALRDSQLRRG